MEAAQRLRQRVGKFQPTKMGHFRPTLTEIPFTDRLRREVLQITNEVRVLLAQTRLPPPVSDGRCRNCSLAEICMPQLPLVLEAEEEMS